MDAFLDQMNGFLKTVNGVIWHNWVLYIVLGTGLLFTLWSGFCQYRALTHGTQVTRGIYDNKDDPGAINHFQAEILGGLGQVILRQAPDGEELVVVFPELPLLAGAARGLGRLLCLRMDLP